MWEYYHLTPTCFGITTPSSGSTYQASYVFPNDGIFMPRHVCVKWIHCHEYSVRAFSWIFPPWSNSPTRVRGASFLRFRNHPIWHTAVGRTPLDEGSARRRDLYLTTNNTSMRRTSMSSAIPASDVSQTHALDLSATGIGYSFDIVNEKISNLHVTHYRMILSMRLNGKQIIQWWSFSCSCCTL